MIEIYNLNALKFGGLALGVLVAGAIFVSLITEQVMPKPGRKYRGDREEKEAFQKEADALTPEQYRVYYAKWRELNEENRRLIWKGKELSWQEMERIALDHATKEAKGQQQ